MNETPASHPTRVQLSAFTLGQLSAEESESIGEHVVECESCCATLNELADRSDAFLLKLQDVSRSSVVASAGESRPAEAGEFGRVDDHDVSPPQVEGYEILDILGRGGMGVVYRARQAGLDRLVALKIISAGAHAGPEERIRFRKEAEAVAQLAHPHIVQIYDIGTADGVPYFTMELVEGSNLKEAIAGVPWNPKASAELVQTLARTIQTAHDQGIIHRDLKPANILLVGDMGDRNQSSNQSPTRMTPKITDFGLAKRLNQDSALTKTGMVAGTPGFMAPEQALGRHDRTGVVTDVYALGAILYNLITGRPPFQADTSIKVIQQVLNEDPVSPRSLNPSVARDLETICLKCLEKEATRRYASADKLADDLSRFLKGEPIRARKTGTAGKVWRWAKRNRRLAIVSAVLLILLVVAAIAGPAIAISYQQLAMSEQESADDARAAQREANSEAARAETERRKAIQQAAVSNEVSNFLLGLFDDADPFAWSGRVFGMLPNVNPSALHILDRGAQSLSNKSVLNDRPLVRATMLDKIGSVYLSLGRSDKARPLLTEALRLRRQHLRAPHADLAASLHSVGFLNFAAGNMEDASRYFQRAYAMRVGLLGAEHPVALESKVQLGIVDLVRPPYHEGETLLRDSLETYRRRRSDKSIPAAAAARDTQWMFMTLAVLTYHTLQKKGTTERLKALTLVIELQQLATQLPNKHLGEIVFHFIEAEKLHKAASVLGRVSTTAAKESNRKAEAEYLRAISLIKKTGIRDHYMLAWVRRAYGYCLIDQRRHADAEVEFQEAVRIFKLRFGDASAAQVSHLLYRVAVCINFGRLQQVKTPQGREKIRGEIEDICRDVHEIDRRTPKQAPLTRANHAIFYAVHLLQATPPRFAEAEPLLQIVWKIRQKHRPRLKWGKLRAAILLLESLVGQKKFDEAENLLREVTKADPKRAWRKRWDSRLVRAAEAFARNDRPAPAMQLLRDAVRIGYREHRYLSNVDGFRSLRKSKDFKALLQNMRAAQ